MKHSFLRAAPSSFRREDKRRRPKLRTKRCAGFRRPSREAWAKHAGHGLAKIMADDVDFVTVATAYLHGRADFEKFHGRLLGGRSKEATNTVFRDHGAVPPPGDGGGRLELENRR